jgi:hypothetical protein
MLGERVIIGDFKIDVAEIRKEHLLAMRLILPEKGYKLLKNRKNSRLQRKRKTEMVCETSVQYDKLFQENEIIK